MQQAACDVKFQTSASFFLLRKSSFHPVFRMIFGAHCSTSGGASMALKRAEKQVDIELGWQWGAAAKCPECGRECSIHDGAPKRTWRHLDTMQFETLIRARVPRSDCPEHGVKTMQVPWAAPQGRSTGSKASRCCRTMRRSVAVAGTSLCKARTCRQCQCNPLCSRPRRDPPPTRRCRRRPGRFSNTRTPAAPP